jgi:hypothetical protein
MVALPSTLPTGIGFPSSRAAQAPFTRRSDAELAIQELVVLREAELHAPADATELVGPLVDLYRGQGCSGDHLRLPRLSSLDGPSLRAAVARVLDVDTGVAARAGAHEDDLRRESGMRRVLLGLQQMTSDIQLKAALGGEE